MTAPPSAIQEIKIAHSPDSDDAFMFYGLATNKVRVPGFKFTHTLTDIETLNQRAIHDPYYDVTAISFHAYPYLQETYTLMACGGSVGEGYGPMVVSPRKLSPDEIRKTRIAVPGTLTTAYLALKLFNPAIATEVVPFDRIIAEILSGKYDLVILDEINYALHYGFLPVEDVVDFLKKKPEMLHVILTGRNAKPEVIEIADMVTEMNEIKHPFNEGIVAQKGIEF